MDEEIHTTDTHSVESSHEPPLSQTDDNNQQNQMDTNNTDQQLASTIGANEAVNVDNNETPVYEEINNNEIQLCFACQKERATVVCSHCCNASSLNSSNANTNSLLDKIPTINYSRNEDDEATNESQSPVELVKSGNLAYCQECHEVTRLMNENDSPIVCTHCSHKNANPVDRIPATNHEHKSERSIARELVKNGNLVYCEECFEIIHLVKKNHIPIPLLTTTQVIPTSSKQSEINNNQEEVKPAEEQTQLNTDQVILNQAETEPQATIQPSETIELKHADENQEKQNINDSFAVINDLSKDVVNLMKRCEQLNDVKQSIRQMNDQIKDDLYIDFASVAAKLKAKLDEMTDKIKEKLKDAYTVVRDAQTKLSTKLNELRDSLRELEFKPNDEHLLNKIKHITEQINFIQDELKMICEPNSCSMAMGNHFNTATASYTSIASTYSCSLFLDNYLYPQFNYYVDLTQLVESIRKLDVNINILPTLSSPVDINRNLLLTNNIDLEFSDLNQLADNMSVDCLVSSGINNDGSFWLQPVLNSNLHTYTSLDDLQKFKKLAQKVNLFLEELSKFVRRKRIGDREWKTFAEASLSPQQNDKCFCLETKTRRWMRSQIVAFEPSSKTCQVRHLDTGLIDTNSYTLDNLIPWKDFGLANLPYRALRCVLYKHNNNNNNIENGGRYENDIQLETRFLFKDLTTNQALKCSLVERIKLDEHDDVWIVKLIRNGDFRHVEKSLVESENVFAEIHNDPHKAKFLINEKVIKSNEQEKQLKVNPTLANRKFGCNDIRVEAGQMEMSQRSVITGSQTQETTQPIAVAQSDAQSLEVIKEDNTPPAQATVDGESKQSDEEKKVPIEVVSSQTSLASTQPELEGKTQPVEADLVVKDEVILPSQTTLDLQSIDDLSQKEKTEEMTTNASSVSLNQQLDDHLQHDPSDIMDIIDQADERRLHRSREGTCRIMSQLGRHGSFWIKPHLDIQMSRELDDLREFIGEFIRKTQYKSYGELKLVPEIWRKCFIRHTKSTQPKNVQNTTKSSYHQNAECHIEWDRGFIEEVNRSKEVCFVRLMDAGRQVEVPYQDIYPHRRLDLNQFAKQHNYPMTQSSFKLNYAAIRCCLFSTLDQTPQMDRLPAASKFFRQVTLGNSMNFKLVKQVYSKNTRMKYWMVTLQTHEYDDVALALMFKCNLHDERLLSTTPDTKIVQSKSADICKMSTANSETMMAELTHSSLKGIAADDSISNRDWIHVETRQVRPPEKRKKKKKRSRSLNRSDREKRNEMSASSSMRRSKSIVAPRRTVDSPAESTRIVSSRSQTSAINQGIVSRIAKILNLPSKNSSTTPPTPAKPAVSNSKSTTNVTESQSAMTQSLLSTTQPLTRSGSDLLHSELLHQHQHQSMINQLHTLPPPNPQITRQASWESGIHNPKQQQQLHSRHNMDSNRYGTRHGNALLPRSEFRNDDSNNNSNTNINRFSEFTSRNRKQYELRQGMGEPPSDLMEHDPTSNPKSLPSSSRRRDPKPRNNNRFDNCKQDFHNYHRRDHHRDDDNYGSGGGGGGNRFYQQSQYNSQGGGGGGNGHSSAGGSGNRHSYGNKRQQLSYDEMGPSQIMTKNNTYLVAYQGVDDDNDQSSSIFNDVFIEDDEYVELDEHAEKFNYQSPAFYGHLAMRGHFLNEDAEKVAVNQVQCRQVDLMELEDYADLFDMPNGSHNSRLANANYLNSSPNSPYQKLFKLHVPNSYEPVLNRISENDSIRTNNNNNCTHADVHSHVNEPETVTSASSSLNYHMLMNDEIERKRGVEPNSEKTSDGDAKNGKGFKSTNAAAAESSDEVLANLIVDESSNSLDLTMYDDMLGLDDGEPGVELDADAAAATTLDITQPVANRHAILFPHFISTLNDRASNNNKSISSTTNNAQNGRQFGAAMMRVRAIDFNHRILKHRSFSADIALMDAKKTNDEHKKLIISPSTSSSSSSSSTSSSSPSTPSSITLLKKQMQLEKTSPVRLNSNNNNNNKSEDEENESYASCAEEIKSNSSHSLAAAPTTEHKLKSYDDVIFKSNPNMNFNFSKYDSIKIEEPKYISKNNNVNLDHASDSKQNSTTSSSTLTARLIESSRRFSSTPNLAEFVCASTAHHGAADTTTADLVDSSACCKNNNDNNALCLSKKERIKNFTVAIFVDSFEDYSLNKTPPSGESSTLSSSTIQLRSPAKETDSLREFEQTERKLKAREPELTDDPFIFDSNPNNYSLIEKHILNAADGQQILASKPPILPTPNNHSHHSNNNNNNNSSNNSNSNNAALVQSNTHNCLSTITEYSNETYETTCSSNNNGNNNAHSDDNDATTTGNRNVDFKRKLDYFNNRAQSGSTENLSKFVTVRRGDLKKSRSSDESAQSDGQSGGCFEPQAAETPTAAANRVRTSASLNELSKRLNELLRQQQRLSNDANVTIVNRTSPSILVTDLLFEKFCLLSNDEILVPTSASSSSLSQSFSLEQNMTNTSVDPDQTRQVKFVPNNSNCFKINSKLLTDLLNAQDHEQLSSILSMDSKLLTNATANSQLADEDKEGGNIGESMDANSQFTSSSLLAESNPLEENAVTRQPVTTTTMAPLNNDTANQWSRNNNNRSALENSSCTSDSLFNSNLIITPMYSEAVSPTQLGSLLLPLKSPLLQPITPPYTSSNQRAHATADSTLKSLSSSFRSPTSGVPPAPPLPDFFLHRANVSPPLPPPPAEYSPLPNELDENLPLPPPPVIPTAPPMPASNIFKSTKAPAPQPPTVKKNKQKPAVSSLIESLTARLNLIQLNKSLMHNNNNRPPLNVNAKSNTEPNSPKITLGSSQPTSVFRNSPIKINSSSMQNLKSSPKFNSPSYTDNFLHNWQKPDYLNRVQSTKSSSMRLTSDTTDRVDKKLTTASSWTGANFSLYGLDTDETVDQQQQQQTLYVKNQAYNHSVRVRNLSDSRVPWPPTPVSPNGGVDFYANLVPSESEQSISLPPPPSQFQTSPRDQSPVKSIPLPPPISPLLHYQPQPAPAVPRPMPASSTHSSSSSVTTVINAQNPTRLSSFLKSIEQDSKTWTSLNPANINAADVGTGDKSAPPDPSSDSSVPNATKPFNSCPNLADQLAPSFKLDHLADINPKRLYKNSKFRCRIHDVIDERGQFWLEVIYSKEDERKFAEMYRLLRLGSRMSQPPGDVPVGRRLSALYKGDWHRAVVIEPLANNDKVKVKFLDLGIVKILDRLSELRVVDEKFFNFPLKALKCSIYLDEDIDQLVVGKKLISNEKLSLSKEARKFFIRLIYKKVLFAKVVDFKHEFNADNEKSSVCRIKLGYQVQRGIIDVYMYILSKYDRKRYELMKMIAASASTSTSSSCVHPVVVSAPPLPQPMMNDSVESSSCTTPTPVESNTNELNHKAMLASPTSSTDEKITEIDKKVEQLYENMIGQANVDYVNAEGEYDEEETRYNEDEIYDFRYINNRIIEREIEVIGQRSQTDDEDQYQDQETAGVQEYFDNDDMLFSEIGSLLYRIRESELNEEDEDEARPLHGHSRESSSSLQVDGEKKTAPEAEGDDDDDDDNDYGLDFTPVKGDNQLRIYNYDGLRIEPINLPSLDGTDGMVNDHIKSRDQAPLYARRPEDDASTVKVNTHSRLRVNKYYRAEDLIRTPISIPMANPVKSSSNRYSNNLMANYNSDTDSSIHAPCCKIPSLKIRKNSNKKENNQLQSHRNLEHQRKIVEEFTSLIATKNGVSKKVKFQVK